MPQTQSPYIVEPEDLERWLSHEGIKIKKKNPGSIKEFLRRAKLHALKEVTEDPLDSSNYKTFLYGR